VAWCPQVLRVWGREDLGTPGRRRGQAVWRRAPWERHAVAQARAPATTEPRPGADRPQRLLGPYADGSAWGRSAHRERSVPRQKGLLGRRERHTLYAPTEALCPEQGGQHGGCWRQGY